MKIQPLALGAWVSATVTEPFRLTDREFDELEQALAVIRLYGNRIDEDRAKLGKIAIVKEALGA